MLRKGQLLIKVLTTLLLFIPCFTSGQVLEGVIKDTKGITIPGAHIYSPSLVNHIHSDNYGKFVLYDVSAGDTLVVSHIGFESKTIVLEENVTKLEVVLRESIVSLDEILIFPDIDAINLFTKIDIQTNPVKSSQEILRKVPGLIIGQHAGGGKAEQIFLRGFDIDHGTDVNINVDGIPVNMVSHAHGQGYADLHFLIPETVQKVDFGKGPYYADQGNFTTAGYVEFITKEKLEESALQFDLGQFNSMRTLAMFNVINNQSQAGYIATEYITSDGPFDSPQNFSRFNLMGKYTTRLSNQDKISIMASHFTSKWDASGQIPQRSIDDGSISRFGAIDDTEGGITGRSNFKLDYNRYINDNSFMKNTVYMVKYDFELYSNFTFFLNDPVNGDQIRQKENRTIFGFNSEWNSSLNIGDSESRLFQVGIGLRNDQSDDNELSRTLDRRTTLNNIRIGDINETNLHAYTNINFGFGKWLFNPGLRLDYFNFEYNDALAVPYKTESADKAFASPKLNILYNHNSNIQGYLKAGVGFHSNDTRVVVAQNGKEILPAAYGMDLGVIWKPQSRILINTALWYLFLEQEFVYVGDEGVVEPSGQTRRSGIDFGLRYQITDQLFFNTDINYALARSIDEESGNDYIPLAPSLSAVGGLNFISSGGFYGGLNYRYIKDRPANEDNSIVATGYFITDLTAGYEWKNFGFTLNIENLFDTEWNETQFATESRLFNEAQSTEEIHLTPGTPFFMKGSVRYSF